MTRWTWRYSSGLRRRKSCRVFDGGSSLYRAFKSSQSKLNPTGGFLAKSDPAKRNEPNLKRKEQRGRVLLSSTLRLFSSRRSFLADKSTSSTDKHGN